MKTEKTFDQKFWIIAILFIILITGILFLPYKLTQRGNSNMDFTNTGEIGDTIGGIMSPFIAIVAAGLTFLAFWIQYKANQQLRNDLKIERFENKFYEMLKLYKENVKEMSIGDKIKGRKCFNSMFKELREAYRIIDERYDALLSDKKIVNSDDNDRKKMEIAYQIFFHGIGDMSEKNYFDNLDETEKKVIESSKKSLKLAKGEFENSNKKNPEFVYNYFDGNVHRLSHYFRHLYQTIKFICDQNFLDKDQKYSYLKTLRAQTSETEQLIIYYNVVTWYPAKWKKYFIEYRFIKNIPLGLADFYINPRDYYKKEIDEYIKKGIAIFEENEKDAEKHRKY